MPIRPPLRSGTARQCLGALWWAVPNLLCSENSSVTLLDCLNGLLCLQAAVG